MFKKFFKSLANDVHYGEGNPDSPKCPKCGDQMKFSGGDLKYGKGHWDCQKCSFTFSEDDLNKHLK